MFINLKKLGLVKIDTLISHSLLRGYDKIDFQRNYAYVNYGFTKFDPASHSDSPASPSVESRTGSIAPWRDLTERRASE